MSSRLWAHPQVLALLLQARETTEDDGPRLVLADWLEDHGEADRAEFIRLQLRLAPGSPSLEPEAREALVSRSRELLDGHGGCWLGPLWRCHLSPACWHRGLLSVGVPRRTDLGPAAGSLGWVDTLIWQATGHRSFGRLARLLELSSPNHLFIDLRRPVREDRLLEHLRALPAPPCLRTLSFDWPLGLLRGPSAESPTSTPAVSCDFLARLACLPLCRRLTHLASVTAWSPEQVMVVRSAGVEPTHADGRLWMHAVPASRFGARRNVTP